MAGPYAFVFWNDDLDERIVSRQLRDLAAAGFRGVTLCARIGLSREVGYLTGEFLRLVRHAVEECARLGLRVVLYDEASYPSGSANGAVVARDPRFAARCLAPTGREVQGPSSQYWRPSLSRSLDDRLVAVVLCPEDDDGIAADRGRLLPVEDGGLVRIDVPAGRWRAVAVLDTLSGGTIRGAHEDQDDGSATAPAAADLLNPDAVQAFVETTHEKYAAVLGDHLGATVEAVFTDEPMLTGRNPRPGSVPWTPGFSHELAGVLGTAEEEVLRLLPTLWHGGGEFPEQYARALRSRVRRVYYGTLARWCADHGLALTGHPAEPDDLGTTRTFQWPGQDTVWRWVLPGDGTALTGPESTAPKVAASAAHVQGHDRSLAEVLGAYGWELTLEELKWLLDWYLSRGVTTLLLHAFFTSVRGGRAYESEPDLGEWNSLRTHVAELVRYVARTTGFCEGARNVAPVAVLSDTDRVGDGIGARLLQRQVDFFHVGPDDVRAAQARDGVLRIGDQAFRAVVIDVPGFDASGLLAGTGVPVLGADVEVDHLVELLVSGGVDLVRADPPVPDLRISRWERADGSAVLLCCNEGESDLRTRLVVGEVSTVACHDPLTGRTWGTAVAGGRLPLDLERRGSLVVELGGQAPDRRAPQVALGVQRNLTAWTGEFTDTLGGAGAGGEVPLGNWALDRPRTSGTVRYRCTVELPVGVVDAVLDLGVVGEAATVSCNGRRLGSRLWAPFRFEVPRELLRTGDNLLEVVVSNSPVNHYEGAGRVSGLVGPVVLSV
ncbi:glycosyl hydrolase family 2 protein [Kineococcus sp. SYSU DK003]|uniref:hypothetical protein n=1 Tax=Kineococcus sp. SYSU DK003 TaxID=3383124 RepID=UPI003D7EC7D1